MSTAPPARGGRIATRDPAHRRAEQVMGTVVSLYLPDGGADGEAADRCFDWLHHVDASFSPFRPDSEVSRLMRGEVGGSDVSPDLAEVLELASIVEALSDGVFDIRAHRTDGAPDPTAVVKGWAVDRAGSILEAGGLARFCFSAGGDVLARGAPASEPWRIGVAHPGLRGSVALVLEASDLAVATSGITERGRHIVDARSARPADELLALSVAGPSLARADTYATAAFAMGVGGLRWTESLPGYAACGITHDGRLLSTPGLARYRTGGQAGLSDTTVPSPTTNGPHEGTRRR